MAFPATPLGNTPLLFGLGGVPDEETVLADLPRESEFLEEGIPKIYPMLIQPIRDLDKQVGQELVKRFLKRPEESWAATLARIQSLGNTDSPATCPEAQLKYLKDQVGFTKALDRITGRLDNATLRRLIGLAVPLWKKRGTAEGLAEWVRLLTARAVVLTDWFEFRWLLGENQLGVNQEGTDTWLIGGEVTVFDEYTSNLHVMDAGVLDRQLLLDLVELSRPLSERIEVVISDLLDLFDEGRNLWTNITTPIGTVDDATKKFFIHPGTKEEAAISVVPSSSYGDYTSIHKFRLAATSNKHVIQWCVRPNNSFFQLTVKATQPELELARSEAGVLTVLGTFAVGAFLIVTGADYTIRIQTFQVNSTQISLKVYLDECLIIDQLATFNALNPPLGSFRISAPSANTADNTVDNVEIFRHPLRRATVQPGAITTSSNFFVT